MFFSRKKPARSYDPATQQPALRCSICTGEQVAGFISPDGLLRTFSSSARPRNWTHSGHGTASRRNAP